MCVSAVRSEMSVFVAIWRVVRPPTARRVNATADDDAEGSEAVLDPTGPAAGSLRVRRGGAYMSAGGGLRVTERYLTPPVPILNRRYIGFRVAFPT